MNLEDVLWSEDLRQWKNQEAKTFEANSDSTVWDTETSECSGARLSPGMWEEMRRKCTQRNSTKKNFETQANVPTPALLITGHLAT